MYEILFSFICSRPPNQLQKKNETVSPKSLSILAQYGAYEAGRTVEKKNGDMVGRINHKEEILWS